MKESWRKHVHVMPVLVVRVEIASGRTGLCGAVALAAVAEVSARETVTSILHRLVMVHFAQLATGLRFSLATRSLAMSVFASMEDGVNGGRGAFAVCHVEVVYHGKAAK